MSHTILDGSIFVNENEDFLKKGSHPVLLIESKGHALHAFVNQKLEGQYPFLPTFYLHIIH